VTAQSVDFPCGIKPGIWSKRFVASINEGYVAADLLRKYVDFTLVGQIIPAREWKLVGHTARYCNAENAGWYLGYMNTTNQQNTESPIDKILKHAVFYAKSEMQAAGHLLPTCFLLTKNGPMGVRVENAFGEKEKDYFANLIRLLAIAHNASAIAFVSEAWNSKHDPNNPYIRPSESPDRIECVSILVESRSENRIGLLAIRRDSEGKFICLDPFDLPGYDKIKGRFTQLMPSRPLSKMERKLAKRKLRMMGVPSDNAMWN